MTVLSGARVVTGDEVFDPGWVHVEGDRIAEVGRALRPRAMPTSAERGCCRASSTSTCTAALADERVAVELINDWVHLHPAIVRDSFTRATSPSHAPRPLDDVIRTSGTARRTPRPACRESILRPFGCASDHCVSRSCSDLPTGRVPS